MAPDPNDRLVGHSGGHPGSFQRILVAVDASVAAHDAVAVAGGLAQAFHARVALLHVVDVTYAYGTEYGYAPAVDTLEMRQTGEALLQDCRGLLPPDVAGECLLEAGEPAIEIVAAARAWGADVIVIGTHSHGRISNFFLGSTVESVVRHAPCPVLTVGHMPASTMATAQEHAAGRYDA